MEFLIGAFVVGLVAAVAFAVYGFRSFGKAKENAVANVDADMAALFSGARVVTFQQTPATVDFATVVSHADKHGYDLTSQSSVNNSWGEAASLVFTKRG